VVACGSVCCGVLQCVAERYSALRCVAACVAVCCSALQYAAVCCSVLQCLVLCCDVLRCVAVHCNVFQCAATCYSVCSGMLHRVLFVGCLSHRPLVTTIFMNGACDHNRNKRIVFLLWPSPNTTVGWVCSEKCDTFPTCQEQICS